MQPAPTETLPLTLVEIRNPFPALKEDCSVQFSIMIRAALVAVTTLLTALVAVFLMVMPVNVTLPEATPNTGNPGADRDIL